MDGEYLYSNVYKHDLLIKKNQIYFIAFTKNNLWNTEIQTLVLKAFASLLTAITAISEIP